MISALTVTASIVKRDLTTKFIHAHAFIFQVMAFSNVHQLVELGSAVVAADCRHAIDFDALEQGGNRRVVSVRDFDVLW